MNTRLRLEEILARAERDSSFRAALVSQFTEQDFEDSKRVCRDAMRDAPEPEVRRQAAFMLLALKQREQNSDLQ